MTESRSPAQYEIHIEGILDECWTAWFEGLHVRSAGNQTVISGPLPDQPALHGVLAKIRDLGLCLISLHRLDPDDPGKRARHETPPRPGHLQHQPADPDRREDRT